MAKEATITGKEISPTAKEAEKVERAARMPAKVARNATTAKAGAICRETVRASEQSMLWTSPKACMTKMKVTKPRGA